MHVKRALKIAAWVVGCMVLLIVLAGAGLVVFTQSDYLRNQVQDQASSASGRKTKIGNIAVHWGSVTHVRLDDVELANPDWAKTDYMFKADRIEFDIRLRPLLHGELVLPQLRLQKPELSLERNNKDQSNWSFGAAPVVSTTAKSLQPEYRGAAPIIGRLEIVDGRIAFIDSKRELSVKGTVQTATGKAGAAPEAKLQVSGTLEGHPLNLHFVGGSLLMLRESDKPYPVDLDVTYNDTKLTLKGTLQDPFQFQGANVQLSLSGSDLADIYPLLGIPGPPTPPYQLTGRLQRQPDLWHLTGMKLHAGQSDLAGELSIDQHEKPARLKANLVSQNLLFADLAPLVGAPPGKSGNASPKQKATEAQMEANGDLFPSVPLHVEKLRAMNMDVTLDAKRVVAPSYLPVQSIDARIQVENGQAQVQPLTLGVGGGTIKGNILVDARTDNPATKSDLLFQDIDIGAFFRGSRFFDATKGKLQGRMSLAGNGHSLAEVMGSANGDIVLAMQGGSASGLMVSLAGLEIGDALVLYVTGDNRIPIRCALGRLDFNQGTVKFDKTMLDTEKSVLHVNGETILKTQMVNVKITADPKQFDLLDLHGPVVVDGKIRSPGISLGRVIPIPTPDLGGGKDVPCDAMIQQLIAAKP